MDTTRVLVVDDDECMVKLLQAKLKTAGIDPSVAYSADEAIQMMTRGLYWIVVADIHMPGMSGVDLVSALKNLSPLVQVIMITSDTSLGRVIECVDRGAIVTRSATMPLPHVLVPIPESRHAGIDAVGVDLLDNLCDFLRFDMALLVDTVSAALTRGARWIGQVRSTQTQTCTVEAQR